MLRAFVFGKFLPFHKGHEAMMRFALEHCDRLSVLICCSDRENIPCDVRKLWISETFAGEKRLEVDVFSYSEADFPNTSVSSREVSAQWSALFKAKYPEHRLLVTSEPYGAYVAEYMGIKHLPFDPERRLIPVSATKIRHAPRAYWRLLPDAVKPWYAQKVAILGTESTGKSTLARNLAAHFSCACAHELARDLIADSKNISLEDLQRVAEAHAENIRKQTAPLIILDTDCYITASYARHFFGENLQLSPAVKAMNKSDLYLYLCADAPYVQDGTRLDEAERNALDKSHRETLQAAGIAFVEISGNWEERFRKAVYSTLLTLFSSTS